MRIKEAAKRTGLTEKTIRYYESVGLVIPDMETKFDRLWRDYSEEHVRLLSAVAVLRRACAALPGSFCAVRRTGRGLCLTLGLPRTE